MTRKNTPSKVRCVIYDDYGHAWERDEDTFYRPKGLNIYSYQCAHCKTTLIGRTPKVNFVCSANVPIDQTYLYFDPDKVKRKKKR